MCKAPIKSSPPTNKPTPRFLLAGCPSCRPTNSVTALKGKNCSDRCINNENTGKKYKQFIAIQTYSINTMCNRNVKSEYILIKLSALVFEYICERNTKFHEKILFCSGVINLQTPMTKYLGFQCSVNS